MDIWHPHALRDTRPNAADRWAAIEAKSDTMRDDLRQRIADGNEAPPKRTRRSLDGLDLLIAVIEALWHFRNR